MVKFGIFEPKFTKKNWGWEKEIANGKYCGKQLVIAKGKSSSIHYHKDKEETFFVHSGKVLMEYSTEDFLNNVFENTDLDNTSGSVILYPGDAFHIPPGLRHRFTGLEDSYIYVFSTVHKDEDSYRLVESK